MLVTNSFAATFTLTTPMALLLSSASSSLSALLLRCWRFFIAMFRMYTASLCAVASVFIYLHQMYVCVCVCARACVCVS
uniref:Uncharacterized protein n=1 Tax=Physcomitrium patens TaxID=3218 RepID=A0A7I3ZN58_PHYPA